MHYADAMLYKDAFCDALLCHVNWPVMRRLM